ncbi:MAG: hypothetical protein BMS9Abin36_1201 [Gammaproteobacteria bacterium]|nr:MAG: hypothetical protein BMS9Abin36_1201 [Gammaproteobacteria bacterium]
MAKFILRFNEDVIDHIELQQGDMKLGRKPTNDIFIDNLSVSGEHANIFTIGEDSFIQDMGSTNGTFVNNKKITKHHLKNGDIVTIGKHSLIYFTEKENKDENTEDFAKTVIINAGDIASSEATPTPANFANETMAMNVKKPSSKGKRQGAIFVLSGANSGKRIELTKPVTNLGKTGKVAGTIRRTVDGYRLVAGSGSEAPKLNGRSAQDGDGNVLKNGDIIEVGGTRLQFYLK